MSSSCFSVLKKVFEQGGKSGDEFSAGERRCKRQTPIEKEKHKFFDEATILVKGGQGGDGEAWLGAKAKTVKNFKYKWGRNMKKYIELPAAEPADGGKGGDVFIRVDRHRDSLLGFHENNVFQAKKGYHGSAAAHANPGRGRLRIAPPQDDIFIDVPPGTVVRLKRSGELLGDLTKHGQTLLVAEGGAGGTAARRTRPQNRKGDQKVTRSKISGNDPDFGEIELDTETWIPIEGKKGEELTLELLMRVVADIGLVGLPNAGKSSILRALTRATPEVAPYPFTTLMPNLGVVIPTDGSVLTPRAYSKTCEANTAPPVLADLPGLIAGAHKGRGLGRAFLRHLRRTRGLVVVVDASGNDPVGDYAIIRNELLMYNPEYTKRKHILVLNKMDLQWAALRTEDIRAGVEALNGNIVGCAPIAIVPVSAKDGSGLVGLFAAIDRLMQLE
jgi:GTPase involved in cell partitioning and DNA repair